CAAPPLTLHSFPTRRSSDLYCKQQGTGQYLATNRYSWTLLIRHGSRVSAGAAGEQLALSGYDVEGQRDAYPPFWRRSPAPTCQRSEEHTSELQSRFDLVCRL